MVKTFPVMLKPYHRRLLIPWAVAEEAYAVYSSKYGTQQSLERIAERGGFHEQEMDDFVPNWRQRENYEVSA